MKEVSLNELSTYSPWVKRVLGVEKWNVPSRTVEKIDAEYDKTKWAKCLEIFEKSGGKITPDELNWYEFSGFGDEIPNKKCVSINEKLYLIPFNEARSLHFKMIREAMGPSIHDANVIVEFGCGYGYNLWMLKQAFPGKTYIGCEYSANAVRLASLLFKNDPDITVHQLDFYDTKYPLLERLDSACVLFTVQAIEQLPSASHLIRTLSKYDDRIKDVFHFEPSNNLHKNTTLGLMRKKYMELNDYNQDLLNCLNDSKNIRIARCEPDVLSINPFNAIGIIKWNFKKIENEKDKNSTMKNRLNGG